MNNTCTMTMNAAAETEKKTTLWERFKKYLMENNEMICGGIIAMNGGHYVPTRTNR